MSTKPPIPPSDLTELDIPEELEQLVMRCLEKDPGQRPQSAKELSALLTALPIPPWTDADAERWWHIHQPTL